MKNVWVLGSSNIDITYSVATIPTVGNTIEATDCAIGTGGKGANQAYAIAYWGNAVGFIGAVGDDENGELLLERLRQNRIDTDNVSRVPHTPSGTAVICVNPEGENCIVVHPGANRKIPLNSIKKVNFSPGDILLSQLEVNIDAIQCSFEAAHKNEVTTMLNPSPCKDLSSRILQHTDMFVANVYEAEGFAGIPVTDKIKAKECAEAIRKMGPHTVVITLGREGAVLQTQRDCWYVPGIKVKPIDTQGAGDAFLGSFVSKLAYDADAPTALSFANTIAAYSVTRHGSTQVSLPVKDDGFLEHITKPTRI